MLLGNMATSHACAVSTIYGNIGGSRPQLSEQQVRRIVTTGILVVEKLKQESQAAYLSNLMNMQIRTFDVER